MSKIRDELLVATAISMKENEGDENFNRRLVRAVAELPDKTWNGLSDAAVEWYNACCDAKGALPPFPDAEEAPPPRRRRAAAEPAEEAPAAPPAPYEPKLNDMVTVTTNRGSTQTGKLIEISASAIVIDTGEEELEYNRSRLTSIVLVAGEAPAPAEEPVEKPAEEPAGQPELEVGQVVEVTVKRGNKTLQGPLMEFDNEEGLLVIEVNGEEREFNRDQLSLVRIVKPVAGKTKAASKPAEKPVEKEEPAGRTRGRKPAAGASGEKPPGLGERIQQLVAKDPAISEADLVKQLTKEKYEFRESSVKVTHKASLNMIEYLKENGRMK